MSVRFITADVMEGLAQLPDGSVHCVVTSPPYYGLRDYNAAGQIGLEATPDLFIAKMVEVFREVRRVLRSDGILWLNLGDSYCNSDKWGGGMSNTGKHTHADGAHPGGAVRRRWKGIAGVKPKDLMGMPWRVAFALQADGWWLRRDIIWAKSNPMPESVEDRPTTAHEYVFMLTKAERYFYDSFAIRETATAKSFHDLTGSGYSAPGQSPQRGNRIGQKGNANTFRGGSYVNGKPGPRTVSGNVRRVRDCVDGGGRPPGGSVHSLSAFEAENGGQYHSRNKRSVWTIATAPFPEAHFATYPPALVEECIKASISEHGCCAECGAPWVREVSVPPSQRAWNDHENDLAHGSGARTGARRKAQYLETLKAPHETLGWTPFCSCNAAIVHCTVLDPFSGAGTTAMVADRLGLDAIGIELNPDYVAMAERRIARDRLERGVQSMEEVARAKLPPTPLEALIQESPEAAT